ncbi:MAG TPA: DNA-binding response regulator [Chitinophagaceae bacterium]|nr:DNA-binding response regulator [Chitinophagaceae bacterium]
MRILLVEDEEKLAKSVAAALEESGNDVTIAYDGLLAERLFTSLRPEFILLDVNLPGKNGFELCAQFRKADPNVPILMLTALGELSDKMEAFASGADDYLVKPFHLQELTARIIAIAKRQGRITDSITDSLRSGDLEMNLSSKEVRRAGKLIRLSQKEFLLLETLLKANGRVLSKAELAEKVWDMDFDTGTNPVEVYINFLRTKIDKPYDSKLIHTRSGFGYYLKEEQA